MMHAVLAVLVVSVSVAIAGAKSPPDGPYVVVLGTAQDGGLPQVGCDEERCIRARRDPSRRRLVASLLLCDPRSGKRWLIDATPDLREQVEFARGNPRSRSLEGPRPPLFEGIFLTHAHVGHYSGLIHVGREAYGSRDLPVFGTERMRGFLEANGPWDLLVQGGFVTLLPLMPDQAIPLAEDLSVTPILVPHRDEYSDTVGFIIAGPGRKLVYIPDIDKWERWDRRIEDVIASVDTALLDGTFFADGEIPGRKMSDIPHPFIVESLERLAPLPAGERAKILFTHLNHTNPASDPRGAASRRVRKAGMGIAQDGMIVPL